MRNEQVSTNVYFYFLQHTVYFYVKNDIFASLLWLSFWENEVIWQLVLKQLSNTASI